MAATRRSISAQVAVVVILYVALRLIAWVLSLPTIVGPDSHSYLPGPGLSVADNGYIGFEKVSFTGDGAIRPWTVSLPYAVLLTDYLRSLFQVAVSCGAFLLLAFALVRVVRGRLLGWTLATITLAFSCTTLVAGWDMLLNRESLSISFAVAFLALALLTTRHGSYGLLLAVIGSALLLAMTRPTLGPLVALVLFVVILGRVRDARVRWKAGEANRIPTVLRGALASLLAVVALAYPLVYSVRLDASWAQWYGQTMSETQFGYVVSDYNPQAAALIADLATVAPACLVAELPVYTGDYVGAPWGFAARMREECPGFSEWYQREWPSWYYEFMAANPTYGIRVGVTGIRLALQPWEPTKAMSPIPAPVRDSLFPSKTADGSSTYDPLYLYWSLGLAIALVAWLYSRRRAWGFVRGHIKAIALTGAVLVGSLGSILVNLLLVPSYPLETNRINVVATLTLRLSGALVAVFATWRVVERCRRGRGRLSPSQAPSSDGDERPS